MNGIDVCLSCFNGGCLDPARHHASTHVRKSGHTYTLNIKRRLKPNSNRVGHKDEEPPAKVTKLAIVEEREEDNYEHITVIKCWKCDSSYGRELSGISTDSTLNALVDGVMQSMSSARQSVVKSWEEEIVACEHTLTLQQIAKGPIPSSGQSLETIFDVVLIWRKQDLHVASSVT